MNRVSAEHLCQANTISSSFNRSRSNVSMPKPGRVLFITFLLLKELIF